MDLDAIDESFNSVIRQYMSLNHVQDYSQLSPDQIKHLLLHVKNQIQN